MSFYFTYNLGNWSTEESVREWSGRPDSNPRSSHTKDSKLVFDGTSLSTKHYKMQTKGIVE